VDMPRGGDGDGDGGRGSRMLGLGHIPNGGDDSLVEFVSWSLFYQQT